MLILCINNQNIEKMKRLILLKASFAILLIALNFNVSFANLGGEEKTKGNKQIKTLFNDIIKELTLEAPIEVTTIISVDEEGTPFIVSINCDDITIRDYVTHKVSSLKFDASEQGTYKLIYKYKK